MALSDTSDTSKRGDRVKTTKMRSKEELAEIVKRALSMSSESQKIESPIPESSPTKTPTCWNCNGRMTRTIDIHDAEVFICIPCTRSSEDPPLPDAIRAWEIERVHDDATGALRAVKICSAILDDYLWLILDRSFIPHDGLACYYAEEIPLLKDKTPEELHEIHKVKLAFPGCRVIQEGAEKR